MTSLFDRKYAEKKKREEANEMVILYPNDAKVKMITDGFFGNKTVEKTDENDVKTKVNTLDVDDGLKVYLNKQFAELKVISDQKKDEDIIVVEEEEYKEEVNEDKIEEISVVETTEIKLSNDVKLFELLTYQLLINNGHFIEGKTKKPLGDLFRKFGRGAEFSLLFDDKYRIFESDSGRDLDLSVPKTNLANKHSKLDSHRESTILFHAFKRVIGNALIRIGNWLELGWDDTKAASDAKNFMSQLAGVGFEQGEISEFRLGVPVSEMFKHFRDSKCRANLSDYRFRRDPKNKAVAVPLTRDEVTRYWSLHLNIPFCFATNYINLETIYGHKSLDTDSSPSVLFTGKMKILIKRLRFLVSRLISSFVLLNINPRFNVRVAELLGGVFDYIVSSTFRVDTKFNFLAMINAAESLTKNKAGRWIGFIMSVCSKRETEIIKKKMIEYRVDKFTTDSQNVSVIYLFEAFGFDFQEN